MKISFFFLSIKFILFFFVSNWDREGREGEEKEQQIELELNDIIVVLHTCSCGFDGFFF